MSRARFRTIVITLFAIAWAASCYAAPYPDDLWLQHLPTLLALAAVVWIATRCSWSATAFGLAVAFLALHVVAARYCYVAVPYDEWVHTLSGVSLQTKLGWTRNHFDRLIHFCYGLFIAQPAYQTIHYTFAIGQRAARFFAIEFVVASSALYEIAEWIVAIVMDPAAADRFNGQQGDLWDAQKDMALAFTGALVAVSILIIATYRAERRRRRAARRASVAAASVQCPRDDLRRVRKFSPPAAIFWLVFVPPCVLDPRGRESFSANRLAKSIRNLKKDSRPREVPFHISGRFLRCVAFPSEPTTDD